MSWSVARRLPIGRATKARDRGGGDEDQQHGGPTLARIPCRLGETAGFPMDFPVELLANAIVAGLLLGGFYAAVTAGISIAFGILDIVNIAHPAFIILGSYIAYIVNANFGIDPILVSLIMLPAFYVLGGAVYQVYYVSFERRGQESLRGLAFFFGLLLRMLIPCVVSLLMMLCLQLYLTRTFVGRAIMAVSQDQLALRLMAV